MSTLEKVTEAVRDMAVTVQVDGTTVSITAQPNDYADLTSTASAAVEACAAAGVPMRRMSMSMAYSVDAWSRMSPTRARCPVCHRSAAVEAFRYAVHPSGSRNCSGSGVLFA